jgi:hypothetical protein
VLMLLLLPTTVVVVGVARASSVRVATAAFYESSSMRRLLHWHLNLHCCSCGGTNILLTKDGQEGLFPNFYCHQHEHQQLRDDNDGMVT